MIDNIKPKEATAIINSLISGVVPKIGLQHITVGRAREVEAFIQALNDVKNGHSMVKFWVGEFGAGKSFILHLLNTVALKQKFVVSNADFTPEKRLYANDGKAVSLFTTIIDNLAIQTKPEGGALEVLLEKWIEQIIIKTSEEHSIEVSEIKSDSHSNLIYKNITQVVNQLTDAGGFDFATVIIKYYDGYVKCNDILSRNAIKWLKGGYRSKLEARQDLGVRDIINDLNYYDMLKTYCRFFVSMGYSGFMINLDEAINLYKISTSTMREKNYEKILSIYNDCFQGKISNLFFNFAGTLKTIEDERRGLFSYQALKSRLETNKYETSEIRDFTQPVVKLLPLNHNEIFSLLEKLKAIFDYNYNVNIDFNDKDIHTFMEILFNKPGAGEFLTPRDIIRDFLNVLSILRQNPQLNKLNIINDIKIPNQKNIEALLEEVEEL